MSKTTQSGIGRQRWVISYLLIVPNETRRSGAKEYGLVSSIGGRYTVV